MTADELQEIKDFITLINQPGGVKAWFEREFAELALKQRRFREDMALEKRRREAKAERLRLESSYLRARWGRRRKVRLNCEDRSC